MTASYIYELFTNKITQEIDPENLIEIFDCNHDGRSGTICYKGEVLYMMHQEHYGEILKDYRIVAELKKMGLDKKKAVIIVYNVALGDYQHDMPAIDLDVANSSYKYVFDNFSENLKELNAVINKVEADPAMSKYYKFMTFKSYKDL